MGFMMVTLVDSSDNLLDSYHLVEVLSREQGYRFAFFIP
jgi:hypothetical protein